MRHQQNFDEHAGRYDDSLARGLAVTGDDKEYFARGRITWLARSLRLAEECPKRVMDYGCGTGSTTRLLAELLGSERVLGVDLSPKSLEIARRAYGSKGTEFLAVDQYKPSEQMDLIYCNGVFHHIPPRQRGAAIEYVRSSLRPRGVLAFWENNPWNPGTRLVMSRIPFDRDAVTLRPAEARRLLRAGGFEILRTDFLFIFPRTLRFLRGLEGLASSLPLGGQYQVLCRRDT